MKDTLGMLLREIWKEKGSPACAHPDHSPERSFSGVITGALICTTCGALIDARPVRTGQNTEASRTGG